MSALSFKTLIGSWTHDGTEYVDEVTVDSPSPELVRAAGSAHHAGVIEVTDGLEDSHVESQEDSEAKLVEAMGEWVDQERLPDGTAKAGYWTGPWYEGHIAQVAADGEARENAEGFDLDVEGVTDDD